MARLLLICSFTYFLVMTTLESWVLLLLWVGIIAVLDSAWVVVLKQLLFKKHIWSLLRDNTDRLAALIVRILLSWWLLIFVVYNSVVTHPWDVFGLGMIFGLVVYGVYECTNQAVLKDRNRTLVLADIAWGMLLCGTVSMILWAIAPVVNVI